MNEQDYLMHYGIKGMKWGVRRFQNSDGTRTALGRQHEAELKGRSGSKSSFGERARSTAGKVKTALTSDKAKKAYKIAGAAVGVAAVAAAAYMYGKNKKAVDSFVKNAAGAALSSSKSSINAGRNYLSNAMDRAGAKARSGLTKAGMKARDLGYSAQAGAHLAKEKLHAAGNTARNIGSNVASDVGSKARSGLTKAGMKARDAAGAAKNAVGTARNVGSNLASEAGAKARSGLTKAGMKARDLGYSAQAGAYRVGEKARTASNTARNIGSNVASSVGSKARSATTRAGMTARSAVNSARESIRSRTPSGEQRIMRGARSSPTTATAARRINSGGMSRLTEGTRYGAGYNPTASGSRGASWMTPKKKKK